MKRLTSTLTALVAVLTLASCATFTSKKPLADLLDPSQGVPVVEHNDLVATHNILHQGVVNGAGKNIVHADACAVSWLAHPELQAGVVTVANTNPVVPLPPTAGVISSVAAAAVNADANARALETKIAIVEAGLPDDIVVGCSLLQHDLKAPGILAAFNSFFHPTVVLPTKTQ